MSNINYIENKDVRDLVKARLDTMPRNIKISIGSEGSFSKEELKEHVDKKDSIGEKIVEIDMEFLQALKRGVLYG